MSLWLLLKELAVQLLTLIDSWGYLGVFALMTIESTTLPIPVPSELVLIPVGYLVAQGKMSWFGGILAGTSGSLFGALLNYALARYIGRDLVYKYGKYFFIKIELVDKLTNYFYKYGFLATFIGRLTPLVRHFISLCGGFAKMKMFDFCLSTALGAALWSTILVSCGYYASTGVKISWLEEHYKVILIIGSLCILTVYFSIKFIIKKIKNN
jgi:membrane protein DedA with SNARE-associated domain